MFTIFRICKREVEEVQSDARLQAMERLGLTEPQPNRFFLGDRTPQLLLVQ